MRKGHKIRPRRRIHFQGFPWILWSKWNLTLSNYSKILQQNGVEKKKNWTILGMARSMLKSKKLANEFCIEAMTCIVYLSNWSPIRSIWRKTSQEACSEKNPSISILRVFGSLVYTHIPYKIRSKLDDKSEVFIFIRYDSNSKGYKLYNENTKKTMISKTWSLTKK